MAGYTDIKTVKYYNDTYIQTDDPYTQPAIFNVVGLTKIDGIIYAIVSIVVLLLISIVYYRYLLLADIMWILMFLFIKYWMIKLVRHNKIKWCNYGNDGNIFFCRRAMAIMRSAFIRLPVCLFFLIKEEGLGRTFHFFVANNLKENILSLIIGAVVCAIGIISFLFPQNCNVESNHKRQYQIFNETRLAKYRADHPTIDCGASAPVEPYSGAGKNVTSLGSIPKFSTSKKTSASEPDSVHVNSTPKTSAPKEKDVFANKRVNRKRREF